MSVVDPTPRPLWTSAQVWTYLNVHECTLRRWLRRGTITGNKVGGRWRFTYDEVQRLAGLRGEEGEAARGHPPSPHAKTA